MLPIHYKLFFLILLLVLNSGCIRFAKYKSYKNPGSYSSSTHHRVKAGETLYSIAFQYGRDPKDVARWNKISKPYTIYPKQKLRIIPIRGDSKKKTHRFKSTSSSLWTRKSTTKSQKYPSKLKWSWPTKGEIVSTFLLSDPGRRGIDIKGKKGQPIKAAAAGRVVYSGSGLRGYGHLIILKHNESYFSAYAHTEHVVVKEKEKVKLGQRLADMSNTNSNKAKLHFEIRRNGKPVNPLGYLPARR